MIWTSSGTGRTLGLKLNSPISLIPNQSARSLALARAVDSPTTRTLFPVVADMKFVRETTTSKTGPLSAPRGMIQYNYCQNSGKC